MSNKIILTDEEDIFYVKSGQLIPPEGTQIQEDMENAEPEIDNGDIITAPEITI